MIFVGITEVLDNAFLYYTQKTNLRAISIDKLDIYAHAVANYINDRGKQAILLFALQRVKEYLNEYSHAYKLIHKEDGSYLVLKDEIQVEKLAQRYYNYPIPIVMEALNNERNLRLLF